METAPRRVCLQQAALLGQPGPPPVREERQPSPLLQRLGAGTRETSPNPEQLFSPLLLEPVAFQFIVSSE